MMRFLRPGAYRATNVILAGFILILSTVSCVGESTAGVDPNLSESVSRHVHLEAPKSRWDLARDAAIAGQAMATIIAIGLGGVFAWRRGYLFRTGQPYITIAHEITHRRVSDGYVQLELTATVHNPSRVKVELRDALFIVQQLAPASDDYVTDLYRRAFGEHEPRQYRPLAWEYLDEIPRVWNKDELLVEPGASVAVAFEYVLSVEIHSVSITTHFYNTKVMGKIPAGTNPRDAENRKHFGMWAASGTKGWNRTTTYDILREEL